MSTKKKISKIPIAPQIYSEAFKRQVVSEFERGLFTKAELRRRYNILGNSCLPRWLKKYGKFTYEDKLTIGRPMKDPQQQRIKELDEIAERELKIDIVKKSGSKQSKK